MAKWLFFLLIICCSGVAIAQGGLGIGTASPNSKAVVDITSLNKGFLLPRMPQQNRLQVQSPAEGLMVYDSTFNRQYQYQDGAWKYFLNNRNWAQSTTRNWMYNTVDSIGIGISVPTEKLDVNGTIRSRVDLTADGNITATGDIFASAITSSTKANVTGNLNASGNITAYGNINLDNPGATLQLQNGAEKKTFLQLSGNDLRFGTNSGNTLGKTIIRMNGTDAVSIDRNANVDMLQYLTTQGNIILGWKLTRFSAPEINMLPIVFGNVPADGSATGWMSPLAGSWSRISVGKYEINNQLGRVSEKSAIIVTSSNNVWAICSATYISPFKFRVDIFDRDGARVDAAFFFVVNDPLID